MKVSELTKEELVLLGESLALINASARRSVTAHAKDPVLLAAFTNKLDRVNALTAKINNMELV